MNRKNSGKPFEHMLEMIFAHYRARGYANVYKVDPPTRMVRRGKSWAPIFLESPFVDYIGIYNYTGRMICIEAKSTAPNKRTLPIGKGGITEKQCDALVEWGMYGAYSVLLWELAGQCGEINWRDLRDVRQARKHVKWEDITLLENGKGKEIWEIL